MDWTRTSGVLLHPTSLPGRFGVGDFGPAAYRWIDWLVQARQGLWQVLPLGPTGFADSPYASLSTFALNPLLISPETLVESGDLAPQEIASPPTLPTRRVDYGATIAFKTSVLKRAAKRFLSRPTSDPRRVAYKGFCREQEDWLEDLALFLALKHHHDGQPWTAWPKGIALRQPEALAEWQKQLASEIAVQRALQYLAFEQWSDLKSYANERGIQVVGDVPIFCAHDSADVWAHRDLFALAAHGEPVTIAGVPPDYFSETGQRWGNPLYRWDVMAERGYAWWIARLRATLRTVDIVRIDHFRGFVAYWEIPASEPTAIHGRWMPGPQSDVFEAIQRELGDLPILAEDLGVITPEVIDLRTRFNLPGMKILQFAFDESALRASFGDYTRNPFLPHNYTRHFAVYTGTHDNDTAVGWLANSAPQAAQRALSYLACEPEAFHWALIRAAMASVADLAIVPLQDVLGLGSEARMNLPGTTGGNWTWRLEEGTLNEKHARRLAEMVDLYERR
jgi:4-alpha-glucanotransferase